MEEKTIAEGYGLTVLHFHVPRPLWFSFEVVDAERIGGH